MNKCGSCIQFKNGCAFSESALPEDVLKDYEACHDFFSERDLEQAMEKAYEIVKKDIQ